MLISKKGMHRRAPESAPFALFFCKLLIVAVNVLACYTMFRCGLAGFRCGLAGFRCGLVFRPFRPFTYYLYVFKQ